MTKGCKIWLWIIFICNLLSIVLGFANIFLDLKAGIYMILAGIVMVGGIALLLFKQKKAGFYLIVTVAAVGIVYNILNGVSIVFALISAVVSPAITYYFINKNSTCIK